MMVQTLLLSLKNEHQRSVNDFCSCILDNQTAVGLHYATTEVLAAGMCKNGSDNIATTCKK